MRLFISLIFVVAACGKNTEPPPPSSGVPNAQPESGPSAKKPAVARKPAAKKPAAKK